MIDGVASRPRVSVLVPYLRAEDTIERALTSVLAQTMGEVEVLAISDGSTDGSREIVRSLAARDARIRDLAMPENGGPARARNFGIASATGEWITVLDADDWYAPDRLARLLDASRGVGAVADNLMAIDPLDGEALGPVFPALPAELSIAAAVAPLATGTTYNLGYLKPMFRRDHVTRTRLRYDSTLRTGEDLLFLLELLASLGEMPLVDAPLYCYRLQQSKKTRGLSTASHSQPQDLQIARALRAFVDQRAETLSPAAVAAVQARITWLKEQADVSRFRHLALKGEFLSASGLLLRSQRVRAYALSMAVKRFRARETVAS